ncbi:MAG: Lactoylglutathione lyase, partial [uncultured Solirubrobacterales bacterium]
GPASECRHPRRRRPAPSQGLLCGARLDNPSRARSGRCLFSGRRADPCTVGPREAGHRQRRVGRPRLGRGHPRSQRRLAGGGRRGPGRGREGRRHDLPAGWGDLLGRLLGSVPRPRRPPVGGRSQPPLDAARERLRVARRL